MFSTKRSVHNSGFTCGVFVCLSLLSVWSCMVITVANTVLGVKCIFKTLVLQLHCSFMFSLEYILVLWLLGTNMHLHCDLHAFVFFLVASVFVSVVFNGTTTYLKIPAERLPFSFSGHLNVQLWVICSANQCHFLLGCRDGPHCRRQDPGGVVGPRSNSSNLTYT